MKQYDCFGLTGIDKRAACSIICRSDCEGCTFYKTDQKFREDRKKAEDALMRKGLKPCIKTVKEYYRSGSSYEKQIMSTERRSS